MYELLGTDEFRDADGEVNRPCYGIFPARDIAEEVAEYFVTVGRPTELVAVRADWPRARRVEWTAGAD